jgi:hypothetical protein
MARGFEMTEERRSHGRDFIDSSNSPVDWGAAGLGVQFRLGILAKGRTGISSSSHDCPRLGRTCLNDAALMRENSDLLEPSVEGDFAYQQKWH